MKRNNQTLPNDEIDLREIILTLWKEKFLILVTTLIFTVTGYIYGTLQPKVYQTTIVLREAPEAVFDKYRSFISTQQQQQTYITSNFNQEFKLNLLSLDHLKKFVEQSEKLIY